MRGSRSGSLHHESLVGEDGLRRGAGGGFARSEGHADQWADGTRNTGGSRARECAIGGRNEERGGEALCRMLGGDPCSSGGGLSSRASISDKDQERGSSSAN